MIKFFKVGDVRNPERGTAMASGIDFFIPNDFETVTIKVGDSIKIPSGLKCVITQGYDMVMKNKSGVALKLGLITGACVVDSDYRGEFNIHLTKVSGEPIELIAGAKIVQGIIRKVELCPIDMINEEEFNGYCNTERGEGGFGSTGS